MVNIIHTPQFQPVPLRSAWGSPPYASNKDWLVQLTPQHLRELQAAVALHKDVAENQLHELTADDFPLPTLSHVLHSVRDEIVEGRGFAIVQGLSVQDYNAR